MNRPKYTVGIDPDSEAHGFAFYSDGKLIKLEKRPLVDFIPLLNSLDFHKNCLFAIEDMKSKKCVYRQHSQQKARPQGEIGRKLGMCQQAQVELERLFDFYGVPYVLFKPQKGNWAETKNKAQFEKATGWSGKSNKDTRSAAFFGYLALKR